MKSVITTHILDVQSGKPASNIKVELFRLVQSNYEKIAEGITNADGRITDWLADKERIAGQYQVIFYTKDYFDNQSVSTLYPKVSIEFDLQHPDEHYHIPLLISANGYTTYRGS